MFKPGDLVRHEKFGLCTVEKSNNNAIKIRTKNGILYLAYVHNLTMEYRA